MRSTRASAAVARLETRSGNERYSIVRSANGLFQLAEIGDDGALCLLHSAQELDEFVHFVNAFGPQQLKRVSKLDVAFELQLTKKK